MCSKKPKVPKPSPEDKPAVLMTARDGMGGGSQENSTTGRKQLRIDLNNSTSSPYGSSLVIPT